MTARPSTTPLRVSASTLPRIGTVMPVPGYDRSRLTPGVVHIGVGGFHRAHQAMYLDAAMSDGRAHDWGIVGVGVMPQDRRMREALLPQDCLYTLVVKRPHGRLDPRVIGSIIGYHLAEDDHAAVLAVLADRRTRIVSLTITEGGYHLLPATGRFDAADPEVVRDAAMGAASRSAFGLLAEALLRRRQHGVPPFTVLSCDNIEGNGRSAREALVGHARLRDEGLAAWIDRSVHFPSSMVDRITPVTSEGDVEALELAFGVRDRWPVVCEPFAQWVVEDDFGPGGRPPLELVGAQLTDDVRPFELMKLRLLNASHQALGYLGYLAGHTYVHEAAADPLFARLLRAYMEREAVPTLRPPPGVDLDHYVTTVIERFANAEIRDSLARICADTSDRIPRFLLPVVDEQLEAGGPVDLSAAVVASWARYAEGVDEQGRPIDVVDPLRDRLMSAAAKHTRDPAAFLRVEEVFGERADDPRFVGAYLDALASLHAVGARATLERLAEQGRI